MNPIIGVGIDAPADLDWVAGQIDRYRAETPLFTICLRRKAEPEGVAGWLAGRGLENGSALAKMMRRTSELPSQNPGVNVCEVGVEDARLFEEIGVRAYGLPGTLTDFFGALPGTDGWHTYIAYAAAEPVGTGAIFVQGDVAWIGFGAVLPHHRSKGIHGAMMLHRMRAVANLDCRAVKDRCTVRDPDKLAILL